jgi:Zn-dependent protease
VARQARIEGGALVVMLPGALPLRIRWTLPLLFICTGCYNLASALGCFLVVVAHEAGHAAIARWRGLYVVELQVHGLGGQCLHTIGTPLDTSFIAWGGVLAQSVLLGIAWPLNQHAPLSTFLGSFLYGLTVPNLLMLILNLMPLPGLDGVEAWRLFGRFADLQRQERRRTTDVDEKWRAKTKAMRRAIEDAERAQRRKDH